MQENDDESIGFVVDGGPGLGGSGAHPIPYEWFFTRNSGNLEHPQPILGTGSLQMSNGLGSADVDNVGGPDHRDIVSLLVIHLCPLAVLLSLLLTSLSACVHHS